MLENVRLQAELQPGEILEWAGRPHPWRLLTAGDWFLVPISLLWAGLVIYLLTSTLFSADPCTRLWGIFFFYWAFYFLLGRFLVSAWQRRHTWYGVTNQRIIILTTTFGHRVQSLYFSSLPEIEATISRSGRGTLLFGSPPGPTNIWWTFGGRRTRAPGFYDIPDARYVFDLISRHRRASP